MDSHRENSQRPTRPNSLPLNRRTRRFPTRRDRSHSPPPSQSVYREEQEGLYEIPYLYVSGSIDNLEKRLMNCTEKLVSIRKLHDELDQETDLLLRAVKFCNANEKTQSNCAVCLDELSKSDIGVLPFCVHVFHVNCMRTWFTTSLTCPTCRQDAHNKDMRRVSPEQAKMFEDLSTSDRFKLVQLLQVK